MEDLKKLQDIIENRLQEIRNKESKTLNEREEYKELQEKLRKVESVMIMIKEMNK